jgi:hypothetical protein
MFSYIETSATVTSISTGIQIDGSALMPTMTLTETGFGNMTKDIDLRLRVGSEAVSCLSVRFVSGASVSGGPATFVLHSAAFCKRCWNILQRVSALSLPLHGGSQVIRGVNFAIKLSFVPLMRGMN